MDISERLNLAETQVYKWWWDQTRKRQKKLLSDTATATPSSVQQHPDEDKENAGGAMLFPSTDEFGGYSSRLRL